MALLTLTELTSAITLPAWGVQAAGLAPPLPLAPPVPAEPAVPPEPAALVPALDPATELPVIPPAVLGAPAAAAPLAPASFEFTSPAEFAAPALASGALPPAPGVGFVDIDPEQPARNSQPKQPSRAIELLITPTIGGHRDSAQCFVFEENYSMAQSEICEQVGRFKEGLQDALRYTSKDDPHPRSRARSHC
jgi:hypothetical protein